MLAQYALIRRRCRRAALLQIAVVLLFGIGDVAGAEFALIPMPREYAESRVIPLNHGLTIRCVMCTADDGFTASDLKEALAGRGVRIGSAGLSVQLIHAQAGIAGQLRRWHGPRWESEVMDAEGYVLVPTPAGIAIIANSSAGLFYAAQTLKQLVDTTTHPATLHVATIRDWPAMKIRGLSDDLSRGPIPTVGFIKEQIRTMAAYKVNLYSPYFEHTFRYTSNPLAAPPDGGALTPAEAREIVEYARKYHVTVVPEQEAFGHLHNLLKWEIYAPLAETQHGQVLTPKAQGSMELVKAMFSELASIFPGPYLHLGADETDELGKGRTMADVQNRGLGAVYLDYLQRVVAELKPLDRRLLFWGDIAMHSPDLVAALPDDFKRSTIAVPWEYNAHPEGFARYIQPFTAAHLECWVAPGVNNWSRVYPNYSVALANIQGFTADGQASGCTGQMNTVWNDDGETLFNSNWYAVLFGAAAAWQRGRASVDTFNAAYGRVFHNDASGKAVEAQKELMAVHTLLQTKYERSDASDSLFWVDPWSVDGRRAAPLLRPYLSEIRLHAERAMLLVRELKENPAVEEVDALDAMELGARRMDLMAYKFQLSDEISRTYESALEASARGSEGRSEAASALRSLDSTNGKLQDLRDGYTECKEMYERAWNKSYRPFWLENNLVRYDMAVELWVGRIDKTRAAQRQLMYEHTLPPASEIGIPIESGGGR